jgi:hypothetical protein
MNTICPVCLEIVSADALFSHVRAEHVEDIGPSWTRPIAVGARRWPVNIAKERCGRCEHYVGFHETVGACGESRCPCPWPTLREGSGERASQAS